MGMIEKFIRWLFHKPRQAEETTQSKVRLYKRSVKLQCGCGKWFLASIGSRCAEAFTCSRCLGPR